MELKFCLVHTKKWVARGVRNWKGIRKLGVNGETTED